MRTSLQLCCSVLCAAGSLAISAPAFAQGDLTTPIVDPVRPEPPLVAQSHFDPSAHSHFYMGTGGAFVVPLSQSGPRSFLQYGGGFEVFFGARLNRYVALELNWQPTFQGNKDDIFVAPSDSLNLNAGTADVKVYLLHGYVQPYLTAGGGIDVLVSGSRPLANGPAFQVGAGADFFVSRFLSLGLKVQYRGAELYGYDRFNDNTYLSMLNVQAVLNLHFPDVL